VRFIARAAALLPLLFGACVEPGPTVFADSTASSDAPFEGDDEQETGDFTRVGTGEPDVIAEEDATVLPLHPQLVGAIHLEAEPQREGDPEVGYAVLMEGAYVGCGVPEAVYELAGFAGVQLSGPPAPGSDSDLPYYLSRFTTADGVDVIAPNCLTCHAEVVEGEVIIGLGATTLDYSGIAGMFGNFDAGLIDTLREVFPGMFSDAEIAELEKFASRLTAVLPYIQPDTEGVNPADNLAAALFAHRDPETLAWSDELLLEPPPTEVTPLDVPAWWRMRSKNSMLALGAGRGDHARIMMTASTLCVDSVAIAESIDETMPDLRAYILSLEAPAYPHPLDDALVAQGQALYETTCAHCHGSSDLDAEYPNFVIPLEVIGTDSAMADGAAQFAERFIEWFHDSFYGEIARLEPHVGYIAPPLSGVWLTAPYFHHGAVPRLSDVLDSTARPTYWRRSITETGYDPVGGGWHVDVLEHGKEGASSEVGAARIYDTTLPGHSRGGHVFGDHLSPSDRAAVVEFLKTL